MVRGHVRDLVTHDRGQLVLVLRNGQDAGLDDDLYDLAYAACYTDDDWRALAQAFETMSGDWKLDHSRRIYRRLGDRGKY